MAATTINVNGIDYAVFGGGGDDSNPNKVIDIISFDSTTKKINLVASGNLSIARKYLAATTINVNGIDYAVFGGGGSSSKVVDIITLITNSNGEKEVSLVASGELSVERYNLAATTINVNGIDYAAKSNRSTDNSPEATKFIFLVVELKLIISITLLGLLSSPPPPNTA